MALMLILRDGPFAGKEIRVGHKKRLLIGRAEDCDLRPNNERVSRYHCELRVGDPDIFVRDLGSGNGTFVNDERVIQETQLFHGDMLSVGPVRFEVVILTLKPNPRRSALDDDVDFDLGASVNTGDTRVVVAGDSELDLAGPSPRLRPPTPPTPRSNRESALAALRRLQANIEQSDAPESPQSP